MTTAREWLTAPGVLTSDDAHLMRNALLAILDELDDDAEYAWEVAGNVAYIIDRELGIDAVEIVEFGKPSDPVEIEGDDL